MPTPDLRTTGGRGTEIIGAQRLPLSEREGRVRTRKELIINPNVFNDQRLRLNL